MTIHSPNSTPQEETLSRRKLLRHTAQGMFAFGVSSILNSCSNPSQFSNEIQHESDPNTSLDITEIENGDSLLGRPFHIRYTNNESEEFTYRMFLEDATTVVIDGKRFQLEAISVKGNSISRGKPIFSTDYTLESFVTNISKHPETTDIVLHSPLGIAEVSEEGMARLAHRLSTNKDESTKISEHFVPCKIDLNADGKGLMSVGNIYSLFRNGKCMEIPNGCHLEFSQAPQEILTANKLAVE